MFYNKSDSAFGSGAKTLCRAC